MAGESYRSLFRPIRIGNLEIKNRIAMAPMGLFGLVTQEGGFTSRAADYFVERARGGTGLLITGLAKIENEIEAFQPGLLPNPSINPAHFISTAGEMNDAVHALGAKIFLQLGIGFGRVAAPFKLAGEPVSASAVPNYWDSGLICRELTTQEVETLVIKAGEAAVIARSAGFDGVEIHAVHEGYLLDQFAISMFNHRTDKYGGDLKGRLTFAIEVLQEIKTRAGSDFPVVLRYSLKSYIKDWNQGGLPGEEFEEKGRDLEEGLLGALILEEAGYDAFNADGGSYEAWYWAHPPGYQKHGCFLDLTAKLKETVQIPVIAAGRLDLPEAARGALADGKADMISLGRGLLADPNWPRKVLAGEIQNIRPCLGCHDGCMWRGFKGKPLSCTVNPACGRERDYSLQAALQPKKIMVVGGGPAGMEAARVAAIRGHQVVLYEREAQLGGHLLEASVPDFKEAEGRLLKWYEGQLQKLNVNIILNTEATGAEILDENPDAVVMAAGSRPIIPLLVDPDHEKLAAASQILLGQKKAGEKIIIIGGGLVGCETALWLVQQGKDVTIAEMGAELMMAGTPVPHMNRIMLIDLLKFHKVKVLADTALVKIVEDGVVVAHRSEGEKILTADTVVMAVGFQPEQELYRAINGYIPELYLIGDARQPKNIMNAVWDAYETARCIY